MIAQVFHAQTQDREVRVLMGISPSPEIIQRLIALGALHYKHVADVVTENVDAAYELTNNIDHDWWKNISVNRVDPSTTRSTSMGDIITMEDGSVQLTVTMGFEKMSFDIKLHATIFEALTNAEENEYDLRKLSDKQIAMDLLEYHSELEEESMNKLIPHIAAWRASKAYKPGSITI